ncbi:MAG: hypothetical protein GY835_22585 [bacterium]|nr:hypothetical protein [bacterium]
MTKEALQQYRKKHPMSTEEQDLRKPPPPGDLMQYPLPGDLFNTQNRPTRKAIISRKQNP